MTLLEAIDRRTSRRTYLGRPVVAERAEALRALVDECNAASGLAIRFVEDGGAAFDGIGKSYGMFKGVKSLFVLAGRADLPRLYEKLGYYGERLALEATRLGFGTCWVGGTFDRAEAAIAPRDGERLLAVVTVGEAPPDKTMKEKLIFGLSHRKTRPATDFYRSDVDPAPDWFLAGIEAVRKAPSAINRQPARFALAGDSVTAYVDAPSATDRQADFARREVVEFVDLGIAELHFELASGLKFSWDGEVTIARR